MATNDVAKTIHDCVKKELGSCSQDFNLPARFLEILRDNLDSAVNAAYFGGVVEEAENQAGEEPKNERLEFEDEMALLGRRRVQAVGSFIPTMKKTREHEFKRMTSLDVDERAKSRPARSEEELFRCSAKVDLRNTAADINEFPIKAQELSTQAEKVQVALNIQKYHFESL